MQGSQCKHAGHAGHASTCSRATPHSLRRLFAQTCTPSQRRQCSNAYVNSRCLVTASDSNEQLQSQTDQQVSTSGQPDRRALLAGAAVLLGTGGFLGTRSGQGAPSFASLEQGSIDLDVALANGKPTIIEFYAAWCGICRELLPVSAQVQSSFESSINFVALNIDNTKWTDEVSQYRVRGVPHFVFLDKHGRQQAAAVGRVPQQMLENNARALADGAKLPFARANGATSTPDNAAGTALKQVMPRDHA